MESKDNFLTFVIKYYTCQFLTIINLKQNMNEIVLALLLLMLCFSAFYLSSGTVTIPPGEISEGRVPAFVDSYTERSLYIIDEHGEEK